MSAEDPVKVDGPWSVAQAQEGDGEEEEEEEDRSMDDGEEDRRAVGPRLSRPDVDQDFLEVCT